MTLLPALRGLQTRQAAVRPGLPVDAVSARQALLLALGSRELLRLTPTTGPEEPCWAFRKT